MDKITDTVNARIFLYNICREKADSATVPELIDMLNELKSMGCVEMAQSIANQITDGDGRSLKFKRRLIQQCKFDAVLKLNDEYK